MLREGGYFGFTYNEGITKMSYSKGENKEKRKLLAWTQGNYRFGTYNNGTGREKAVARLEYPAWGGVNLTGLCKVLFIVGSYPSH